MGIHLDVETLELQEYKAALRELEDLVVYRNTRPWLLFEAVFSLTPSYWKQKRAVAIVHRVSETVIKKRNEDLVVDRNKTSDSTGKKKLAMLDLLLSLKESGKLVNNEGIKEEVNTIIFAVNKCVSSVVTV